jgi:hypothetical protein
VFEHLYHPREFVDSVRRGGVQDVFLAIPNFETELRASEIHVLNTQHTYYCDKQQMEYLFALHGYAMNAYHSHDCSVVPTHMVHFRYVGCQPVLLPVITVSDSIVSIHSAYTQRVEAINAIEYVSPAGAIGQMMWYHLNRRGVSVRGFIDNSNDRRGKRIYGTDRIAYQPYSCMNGLPVMVCPCKYADEIAHSLSQYGTNGNPVIRW